MREEGEKRGGREAKREAERRRMEGNKKGRGNAE